MSDAIAPAATDTSVNAAPPVPAATESDSGEEIKLSHQKLNERLARAKRSALDEALRELGVESLDSAKAAVAKARELEEAKKSEIEKFAEKVAALEPEAKRAVDLSSRLARYADAELAKLTEQQRAAVLAIAGEDKARALDTIEALRPTWSAPIAAAPTPAALPAPAKTTASGAAPSASSSPTIDHKAVYEALKTEHPMKAAQYALAHARDIYK